MSNYESYSFSRLLLNDNIEFFFIQGVNDSDHFDEYWDGRSIEVIGYAVIYKDIVTKAQKNLIYLLDMDDSNVDQVIKYTKKFIEQMTVSEKLSDWKNYNIVKTDIRGRVVLKPYENFIKSIVKNELPNIFVEET